MSYDARCILQDSRRLAQPCDYCLKVKLLPWRQAHQWKFSRRLRCWLQAFCFKGWPIFFSPPPPSPTLHSHSDADPATLAHVHVRTDMHTDGNATHTHAHTCSSMRSARLCTEEAKDKMHSFRFKSVGKHYVFINHFPKGPLQLLGCISRDISSFLPRPKYLNLQAAFKITRWQLLEKSIIISSAWQILLSVRFNNRDYEIKHFFFKVPLYYKSINLTDISWIVILI